MKSHNNCANMKSFGDLSAIVGAMIILNLTISFNVSSRFEDRPVNATLSNWNSEIVLRVRVIQIFGNKTKHVLVNG